MSFDAVSFQPTHFLWHFAEGVATITLNRPERKNPLTFESYAELRDTFRALTDAPDVKVVVMHGAGGNFCSGGDVHEIIGPLTKMDAAGLRKFTTMTGDLVRAMRACPQPIIAAVDGVCAGAGAIIAMASDLRLATPEAKTAFLFTRVGLSGADMGACAILPRLIGHGRAAELLFTGRAMEAGRRPRLGLLEPRRRICPVGSGGACAPAGARPELRPRGHQAPARCRMACSDRRGDRHGGGGSGGVHGNERLPPRLRGLRGETEAGVPGRLKRCPTAYDFG